MYRDATSRVHCMCGVTVLNKLIIVAQLLKDFALLLQLASNFGVLIPQFERNEESFD